jgi:hypothetical protein
MNTKESIFKYFQDAGKLDGGFPFSLFLCYQHIYMHMWLVFSLPPQTISFLISGNCLCSSNNLQKAANCIAHIQSRPALAGSRGVSHKALMAANLKT